MKPLSLILFVLLFPAAYPACRQALLARNTSSSNDTSTVNKLLELCISNYRKNPDRAYKLAGESYNISKEINYTKGIAKSLYIMGISKKYLGQFDSSIYFIKKTLETYLQNGDRAGLASCYSVLGDLYIKKTNYLRAIANYDSARIIFTEINDSSNISKIYNAIGNMYFSQKQYEKALYFHNQSLEINKFLKFNLGISVNYNNIGNIYKKTGNYPKAIEYYDKALAIKKSIGDSIGLAIA
jgi:tetratricopeptide (TPR) repeat protein